ncbi:MAG: hypothetical protein J0L92_34940 [Deltaproteobacteria bacterium]|nr:hypothetical protein [Deltaproteobacteria bacterium]
MKDRHRITGTLALAAIGLLSACGNATTLPYVAGPYTLEQHSFFEQLTSASRSRGYDLQSADVERGVFAVQAHTTLARSQHATFVVQCYRPGWFQIRVEGPSIRRTGDEMSMPSGLFEEYRDYTLALMESVEASRPSGGQTR